MSAMEDRIAALEGSAGELRKDTAKISGDISVLRRNAADSRADLTELREQLQQVRGQIETLQKDLTALRGKTVEIRELKERLDQMAFKVNFIENFLDIGKREEGNDRPHKTAAKNGKGKNDQESLYGAAYENFKEGRYEKARAEFQNFLRLFPRSEHAANAHFWIGECYYFEKNYEKAILEYDKVIKGFPEANKVPAALLKQGLSFLQLGDKTSGTAILQTVIKDYPHTNQAKIARTKLMELK